MPYYEPPAVTSIVPGTFTLAQVMAVDPALYPRKYAWCTDLFGGSPDWVISDGTQWKPVRPAALQGMAAVSGATTTLISMLHAPTQVVTGNLGLGANFNLTLSPQYAWKGSTFRIVRRMTGLGGLLVNGLGISLNSWADQEWDGSAWVQTASGGLL